MQNINVVNGVAAMAYHGETPWHGMGQKVSGAMTSAEAIAAAKLDWKVEKEEIFFHGKSDVKQVADHFATVRQDTEQALGVVGKNYKVLQNRDAFKFFDSIVGEKLAMFHTAGALGEGERIWMLAKLPGEFWVTPEDNVEKYLLLTNSHDGTSAVQIMATPIRVVCQNTLNAALSSNVQKSRVRHTMNMGRGIKEIRAQIGVADQYFRTFEELSKHLVSKKANTAVVEQLFKDLGLTSAEGESSTRKENICMDILRMFEKGRGNDMKSVKGSAWALFNGVTEYVDYKRSARGQDGAERWSPEQRRCCSDRART